MPTAVYRIIRINSYNAVKFAYEAQGRSFFVIIFNQIQAQTKPELRYADKIRIKEAVAISTQFGDQLFTGYSAVPFTIDLITDSTEFLINHPTPSADFILLEKDSVLNTNIYYRKRQFDPHLLATFPAVNGLS